MIMTSKPQIVLLQSHLNFSSYSPLTINLFKHVFLTYTLQFAETFLSFSLSSSSPEVLHLVSAPNPGMMNTEAKAERQGCKDTARVVGFVVSLLTLLWIVHMGYKLTNESMDIEAGDSEGGYISLVFGVITVVIGLIYFIVGLTIVAELALDLLAWLEKGDAGIITKQEKEQKTICKILIQVTATMVSMCMLMWAIYYGYKLVKEAQRVVIYSRLAFLIGVITMAFGFIYFIIGIALVADSALHLSGTSQQDVTENDLLLNTNTDTGLLV